MCNKTDIRNMLIDYVDGSLDDQSTREVAQHLASCEECRGLELEYRETIHNLRLSLEAEREDHIPNEKLVRYVDDPTALVDADIESVELHLAVCPPCEEKVVMLKRVSFEQLSPTGTSIGGIFDRISSAIRTLTARPAVGVSGVAALILVMCIGYLAMTDGWHESYMQFTSSENGVWLHESVRGEQEYPRVAEVDRHITVGLLFNAFFDKESYSVQLRSAEGTILESVQIHEGDYLGNGVQLHINSSTLPLGKYQLVLSTRSLADSRLRYRTAYSFYLVKNRPSSP